MGNFYTDHIQQSYYFNSLSRVFDLGMLEPTTRAAVEAILKEAASMGQPLLVWETYRSEQRQQDLWQHGATQLRVVGAHHFGVAADLVKDVNGQPSWKGSFDFLGQLARKHGLVWGGNWNTPGPHSFIDGDHVQRINLDDETRLFAGQWYPESEYNPYGSGAGSTATV
jgi:hypothetical protein